MQFTSIFCKLSGPIRCKILQCNLVWLLLAFMSVEVLHSEPARFATEQGTSAPRSAFYIDPYIDNFRFSGTVGGHSFEDVTVDAAAQTIFYNKISLWTDVPNVQSTTYHELRPGTFTYVDTQVTISVDPVSTSVMNIGPLTLHQSISEFDIQSNTNGSHGGFATMPLTGSYSISRGTDSASGQFAISLPISRNGQFPEEYLYVNNYPNSIDLQGVGKLESYVDWIDWPAGQNNPNRRTIFNGMLDGFPAVLELQESYFNRNSRITLSPVPLIAGDFNNDNKVDASDYLLWRKRVGTPYTSADYDAWRANFGRASGGASLSAAVPEPSTFVGLLLGVLGYFVNASRQKR